MPAIFRRRNAISPSRTNSTEGHRHEQYPVFEPIFRGSRSNFCRQFRNRVKHRYLRGTLHYCPSRSPPHRHPRGPFGKRHCGERAARVAENPRRRSASVGNAYPFDYSSPSWIIRASWARQSYLQLLSNKPINVPPMMHRVMAVDYGLLRRVYELYSRFNRVEYAWSLDTVCRRNDPLVFPDVQAVGDDIVVRRPGIGGKGRVVMSRRRAEIAVECGRGERSG